MNSLCETFSSVATPKGRFTLSHMAEVYKLRASHPVRPHWRSLLERLSGLFWPPFLSRPQSVRWQLQGLVSPRDGRTKSGLANNLHIGRGFFSGQLSSGDECLDLFGKSLPLPLPRNSSLSYPPLRPPPCIFPVTFVCLFRNIVVLILACLLLSFCIFGASATRGAGGGGSLRKERVSLIVWMNFICNSVFWVCEVLPVCGCAGMLVCVCVHMGANGFDVNCNFMRIFISFAFLFSFPSSFFTLLFLCPAAVSCCACNW